MNFYKLIFKSAILIHCCHLTSWWPYRPSRSPIKRFDILSHNCLSYFADNTSIHGPKWYNLKPNYFCRVLLAIFIVTFLISFPIIFYSALHAAFTSNSVTTTIETQKAVDMKYPNLTVCFAKFFDKQRLDGKILLPQPVIRHVYTVKVA